MTRTDWTRAELRALFDLPSTDLVLRAAEVHSDHQAAGEVQLCTLLSIKTGGCPEDCGYCSQSAAAGRASAPPIRHRSNRLAKPARLAHDAREWHRSTSLISGSFSQNP